MSGRRGPGPTRRSLSAGAALRDADEEARASAARANAAMMKLVAVAAFAALLAALFAWIISRSTVGSIRRIASVTHSLAKGDLDVDAQALTRKDELAPSSIV